jgi:DNA topoisomerase-2
MDGFLTSMLTPIIKAKKGNKGMEFFNMADYESWRKAHGSESGWSIKYYKGLGTSNADEAREYFRKLKIVSYNYTDDEPKSSDKTMELAFNKKMADQRKAWLSTYNKSDVLNYDHGHNVAFEDFVNKELIHFSTYDVKRSIPSICDGLKVSQRKILFSCFKKKWSKECRVAQLSAFVSETSAYHHGEESLNHAIVGLAQDFVGSNNINLLLPNGQFGSRIKGGKDASSPRYIYTELSPITRSIYRKGDDDVLAYLDDDGMLVEPEHYVPIIPMILVNGALGIGTGFSTSIPCYNPIEIIRCIKMMLKGDATDESYKLRPWYRGFKGEIVCKIDPNNAQKFYSRGSFERMTDTKVRITELPIGMWTEEFKEMLELMIDSNKVSLKNYESYYNDVKADFVLHFATKGDVDKLMEVETNGFTKIENEFKLVSTKNLGTTNMYLFDANGAIKKYNDLREIFEDFYQIRRNCYATRKEHVIAQLEADKKYLEAKIVFINEIIDGTIVIYNVPKQDVESQLLDKSYPMRDDSYDYLVGMPIYNLTREKKAKLQHELDAIMVQLHKLNESTPESMWMDELEELESQYISYEAAYNKASNEKAATVKKNIRKK